MSKFLNYMLSRACILSLLLTLAQHAGVTLADPDKTCDYLSTPRVGGICGHHLANLLSMICESLQNSHAFTRYIVKRQTEKSLGDNLRSIMLNKKDALSYLAKREATGSIVCECCIHSCSVFELVQYCDLPSHYRNIIAQNSNNNRALSS
ncbi:hypothetical protein BsWGS_27678 [Bradybaena similaris]